MEKEKKVLYVVYGKDDEILCVGDAEECTKFLGTTLATFYRLVGRTKNGQNRGFSRSVYRI